MLDMQRIRRESMRWNILRCLDYARPVGFGDTNILTVIQDIYPDCTAQELRRELDYLRDRELVTIVPKPTGDWFCDLTRYGIDVVEYTVDVEAGIKRPPNV